MFPLVLALLLTHAFAAGKSACTARELRGRDCRLAAGTYKIRLLSDTIARDDGTWHVVDPMPLKGDGVAWEKITFENQHGRPVLQMWLWDPGKGEAQVQSLHWFVADARPTALKIVADGVVRRRRMKPPPEEGDAKKKPEFLYDGWEKHGLKILKDGKFEWQLGQEKKILDPDAPEKGH
jgi:hypothetical protein